LFEWPSASRTRGEEKMRARPPALRKGKRTQKIAGNVEGGERFNQIIGGESKSE